MLVSYRHPDLADKEAARIKLSAQKVAALVERRRVAQGVPTPATVEHSDDEAWLLRDRVTGGGELTSVYL